MTRSRNPRMPLAIRVLGVLLALSLCCLASAFFHYFPDGNELSVASVTISLGGTAAAGSAVYWLLSLPIRRGDDE